MRKYLLPLVFLIIIVFGCNPVTNFITQYLNSSNLTEQAFTIRTDKDTTIKTTEGIIISIPANSIKADGNRVTLQVKEALTMAEILKAGLTTQAGKDILSSDGMFYIGTKEQSTITNAIHIKLPTANADKNMQLYKGVDKDGKIDWQSPTPIAKTITPLADSGEVLFKTNCTSCHAIDKQLTGTALAWMDKRRSKEWLHSFIQNNQKVLANGDSYANCVYCKYKSSMTVFPNLTNRDIDLMCKYIDKVSKEKGIPENFNPNTDCDSCDYYHIYYNDLEKKKDSLVKKNAGAGQLKYTVPTVTNTPDFDSPESVKIPEYDAEYYQFDISTYGWYNIDLLWKNMHGEVESTLIVKIKGEHTEKVKVYLVIPSLKVLTEGGYLKDSKNFGFDKADGTMPLPQNTAAFIVALSEQNEKLYFVKQRFITSTNQTIEIGLNETDKQTVIKLFAALQPDSVKIEVYKTKNFENIKGVDSTLKTLKDRLSRCGCREGIVSLPSKYTTLQVDSTRKINP